MKQVQLFEPQVKAFYALYMTLCILIALAGSCSTSATAGEAGKRSKVIDFEDDTVEGLNKRPLDSLTQISENDKRKRKPHLYRKRQGFRGEISETLKSLRFTPGDL